MPPRRLLKSDIRAPFSWSIAFLVVDPARMVAQ
jgi:hypothetical protein